MSLEAYAQQISDFVREHEAWAAAQNGALRARPLTPVQAPLNVGTGVVPFATHGPVLGGPHERVVARHVGCVGDMATG
jgi:hypothetical protein